MLILTVRTDKPEAELGMFENGAELTYVSWQAHRELAETIHTKIDDLLKDNNTNLRSLQGVVVFKGSGSFTGLRIGLTVVNALSDALHIPIVSENGDEWIANGIERLRNGENETIALPEYGSEPNITQPKH